VALSSVCCRHDHRHRSMDDDGLKYRCPVCSWTVDHRYPNSYIVEFVSLCPPGYIAHCMQNQTCAECGAGLLSAHYSNFFGGHWHGQLEDVYSTGTVTQSIGYSAETPCGPLFGTQLPYTETYVKPEGASLHSPQLGSVHVIPQQLLCYDYASQVPAMVSGNVPCDPGLNQDMGEHPPPPEKLYTQVMCRPTSQLIRTVNDSLFFTIQAGAVPGPIPSPAQPPYVLPSLPKNEVPDIASGVSMEDTPVHDENKCCPVCPASVRRPQDRKRHKLSHLPHWLQCLEPGCSWRGGRWEHLKKHHLKVHPSSSRELDTRKSMIYDPWPLVEEMTDATAFENAIMIAIALVEARGEELKKSRLWGDIWGRKKRGPRRLYGTLSD
jgi:hypothetical protein